MHGNWEAMLDILAGEHSPKGGLKGLGILCRSICPEGGLKGLGITICPEHCRSKNSEMFLGVWTQRPRDNYISQVLARVNNRRCFAKGGLKGLGITIYPEYWPERVLGDVSQGLNSKTRG